MANIIRRLEPGEPVPSGEPRRYVKPSGYVSLRWRVGQRHYVELYEHRAVMGNPAGKQVHHINGDRSDNRVENLEVVTPREHSARHMTLNDEAIAVAYRAGATTLQIAHRYGCNAGSVSRSLARAGVRTRPPSETLRKPIDYARVSELHRAGHRVGSIARALGSTNMVVRRALRELGLTPYGSGRPPAHLIIHRHLFDVLGDGDGEIVVTWRDA